MSVSFSSGVDSITIKSPDYGDSYIQDIGMKMHLMMDASVRTYNTKITNTLLLNFNGLNVTDRTALNAFYAAHVGDDLIYTDTLGVMYNCTFNNELLNESVKRGSGLCEQYDVTIQLDVTDTVDVVTLTDGVNILTDGTNILVGA